MTNLKKVARPKRIVLALALMLIGAGMLMSATALGYIQSPTDDYGITIGASMSSTDCGPGAVYDYSVGMCVQIGPSDD